MRRVETNRKTESAPLYFLTGLGAGIALAVLLAPRSGTATRRMIGRKVDESEDWMKAKAAAAQEYVSTQGEKLGERIKEAAEGIGRNSSSRLRQNLESSMLTEGGPALSSSRKKVWLSTARP